MGIFDEIEAIPRWLLPPSDTGRIAAQPVRASTNEYVIVCRSSSVRTPVAGSEGPQDILATL